MKKSPNEAVRRMVLTTQTKEKFFGRPFSWGSCDCAKIGASHVRKFGWKVPQPGRYSTLDGAITRLKELKCETLADLVGIVGLPEIPPAFARVGDIVSFQSDAPVGAIGIVLGQGNMLAFHEVAEGACVMTMDQIDRAWSVWNG